MSFCFQENFKLFLKIRDNYYSVKNVFDEINGLQVGGKRVEVAEKKGNTYSWNLLFGKKCKTN